MGLRRFFKKTVRKVRGVVSSLNPMDFVFPLSGSWMFSVSESKFKEDKQAKADAEAKARPIDIFEETIKAATLERIRKNTVNDRVATFITGPRGLTDVEFRQPGKDATAGEDKPEKPDWVDDEPSLPPGADEGQPFEKLGRGKPGRRTDEIPFRAATNPMVDPLLDNPIDDNPIAMRTKKTFAATNSDVVGPTFKTVLG